MPPDSGVVVEFRDEDTGDLVWKAAMHYFPGEDATLEWIDAEGVSRT